MSNAIEHFRTFEAQQQLLSDVRNAIISDPSMAEKIVQQCLHSQQELYQQQRTTIQRLEVIVALLLGSKYDKRAKEAVKQQLSLIPEGTTINLFSLLEDIK